MVIVIIALPISYYLPVANVAESKHRDTRPKRQHVKDDDGRYANEYGNGDRSRNDDEEWRRSNPSWQPLHENKGLPS